MRAISERFAADAPPAAPRLSYPGLAAALARDTAERLKDTARAGFYRSMVARLALGGPLPAHLTVTPDALTPATLEGAQDILRGSFLLPSGMLTVRGQSPFDAGADDAVRAELHRFEWLAHLEKGGGRTAAGIARALTEDWLDRFTAWHALAWRPDVLGPRLVAWAAHFRFLTGDHDLLFRSRLMKAMTEQTRHLARSVEDACEGLPRLTAAAALVVMAAALPDGVKRPERAFAALDRAMAAALGSDGGIVTRSPADQAAATAALLRARRALEDARIALPPALETALTAATARLAMLRHGDGGLACFHGSGEGDPAYLSELVVGARRTGPDAATDMGYARLASGDSLLIFDHGGPPPGAFAANAHAAPLAFEFTHRDQRLIVNGGTARRRGAAWIDAARRTAAHATLEIGGADAGALLDGGAARRLGARLYGGHATGEAAFSEAGGWAEGAHDFWMPRFGAEHRRRLFLDAEGEDLRGEDSLIRIRPRGALEVAVRFPLHPDVRATLAQGGDSVILAPPGGPSWRFRAEAGSADATLRLEDAVYMGGETVRKTVAIVVRAAVTGAAWKLRWALKTESPAHRPKRRLV
ncbi:MAG: heparinase II/III family protein [Micropepsaceae bacterium]